MIASWLRSIPVPWCHSGPLDVNASEIYSRTIPISSDHQQLLAIDGCIWEIRFEKFPGFVRFPLKPVILAVGQGKKMPSYSSQQLTRNGTIGRDILVIELKCFFPLIKMNSWVSIIPESRWTQEDWPQTLRLYSVALNHHFCKDALMLWALPRTFLQRQNQKWTICTQINCFGL